MAPVGGFSVPCWLCWEDTFLSVLKLKCGESQCSPATWQNVDQLTGTAWWIICTASAQSIIIFQQIPLHLHATLSPILTWNSKFMWFFKHFLHTVRCLWKTRLPASSKLAAEVSSSIFWGFLFFRPGWHYYTCNDRQSNNNLWFVVWMITW